MVTEMSTFRTYHGTQKGTLCTLYILNIYQYNMVIMIYPVESHLLRYNRKNLDGRLQT